MKKVLLSLLMLALAMPAFAFDIPMADGMKLNMYGQVRMTAAYEGTNTSTGQFNATTSDFKMKWQGNSRLRQGRQDAQERSRKAEKERNGCDSYRYGEDAHRAVQTHKSDA